MYVLQPYTTLVDKAIPTHLGDTQRDVLVLLRVADAGTQFLRFVGVDVEPFEVARCAAALIVSIFFPLLSVFWERSRWGSFHCRKCTRRTHWRLRQPRSSRWHRRGLRWGRCATDTLAGRFHAVCTKLFFFSPSALDNFMYGNTGCDVFSTILYLFSSKSPTIPHTLYIIQQARIYWLQLHQLWWHLFDINT